MHFFKETQKMDQWWVLVPLYLVLLGITILFGYGFHQQLVLGEPWGNQPLSDNGLILISILVLMVSFGVLALITTSTLETKVTKYGIEYKYWPFVWEWKKINKEEIQEWVVRKYSPIFEYGGWGYRMRGFKNIAYSAKGNQGLDLKLASGHKKMFGTQMPNELQLAMEKLMSDPNDED